MPVKSSGQVYGVDTALLPANWAAPDFDDQDWPRAQGPFFKTAPGAPPEVQGAGYAAYEQGRLGLALLCIRGKFAVTNPKTAGDLTLSCDYRGGVVVCLNGNEVARGHLPDPDKKGLEALAEDYSNDVCVDEQGKPIGMGVGAEKNADRLAKRIRHLTDVKIPAANLRQGVNVLAVEVHRSPYPEALLRSFFAHYNSQSFDWIPIGLVDLQLKAAGAGVVPNVPRPSGLQLWPQDLHERVTIGDCGDPNESPAAIRMVGARNGSFCGRAVLGNDGAIRGARAEVSDLKSAKGDATIAAANVMILYGQHDNDVYKQCLDDLATTAPDEPAGPNGADLPIVIRVRAPKDAAAGEGFPTMHSKRDGHTMSIAKIYHERGDKTSHRLWIDDFELYTRGGQ